MLKLDNIHYSDSTCIPLLITLLVNNEDNTQIHCDLYTLKASRNSSNFYTFEDFLVFIRGFHGFSFF